MHKLFSRSAAIEHFDCDLLSLLEERRMSNIMFSSQTDCPRLFLPIIDSSNLLKHILTVIPVQRLGKSVDWDYMRCDLAAICEDKRCMWKRMIWANWRRSFKASQRTSCTSSTACIRNYLHRISREFACPFLSKHLMAIGEFVLSAEFVIL